MQQHDTWYLINGSVLMNQGEVLSNPFEVRFEAHPSALWVIENESKVKRVIGSILHPRGATRMWVNVPDCYHYIVHYFLFQHAKEGNSYGTFIQQGVSLGDYTLRMLRTLTLNYINDRNKEMNKLSPFLSGKEMESTSGVNIETYKGEEDIGFQVDTPQEITREGDLLLQDLCTLYHPYFFHEKGFMRFDLEKYFTYMYLTVNTDHIEQHLQYVSKQANMPLELVTLVTTQLREGVKKQEQEALEVLDMIQELLREKKERGWLPRLVREGVST